MIDSELRRVRRPWVVSWLLRRGRRAEAGIIDAMSSDGQNRSVRRPRVAPGPLRDLKRLLHELYEAAGAPSLKKIAELVADSELPGSPSKDTIWRCLASPDLPPNQADAVAVAVVLAHMARWDVEDAARRVKQYWVDERLHPGEPPRTVDQWTPISLGVQRVVDTPQQGDAQAPPGGEELTAYLPRAHDMALRRRLQAARDGASVLVVLVGGSSTGKTRALYEAVGACLPDWPLLVPRDAAQLHDWITADAIDAGVVLWLDEAQRFLPAVAESLAALLERVRPLAVVAAMWPPYWDVIDAEPDVRALPHVDLPLRSVPSASASDHAFHARRLVQHHRPRISVPDSFDDAEIQQMHDLSSGDVRLAVALNAAASDGRVIQHLTGGPELVARYEDGSFSPLEHAVITAALDVRRLGHASPIPAALLAEAAAATLPGTQRVSDDPCWIDTVLDTLCHDPRKRVRGALTALIADRTQPGIGPPDGYHPADYLDQRARRTRCFQVPPEGFWIAAARHAVTPEDLTALGDAAYARWRHRTAAQLYGQAVQKGNIPALRILAAHCDEIGNKTKAEHLLRRAVDTGDIKALSELAERRERAGDEAEADRLYQQAADAGDTFAQRVLARKRERAGDEAEAERLYQQAAHAGDTYALRALARRRERAGDPDEAERFARLAADAGDTRALRELARSRGRAEESRLYRIADARHLARRERASNRERAGDGDDTRRHGPPPTIVRSAVLHIQAKRRERAGEHAEAEQLYRQAFEAGDESAAHSLAMMLEDAGKRTEAERVARLCGQTGALWDLAELREEAGDRAGAERLARLAVDGGNRFSLCELARRYSTDPRLRQMLQYGLEADGRVSEPWSSEDVGGPWPWTRQIRRWQGRR